MQATSSGVEVTFALFEAAHTDELIAVWRSSFEAAVGVPEPHTAEQQRHYFLNEVLPKHRVLVALSGEQVVGFIAACDERIDQLYVRGDHRGVGVGTRLLQWAKDHSRGRLHLFTFERNHQAQRFYESRGFRVGGRGFSLQWQLPDIRYEWTRIQD